MAWTKILYISGDIILGYFMLNPDLLKFIVKNSLEEQEVEEPQVKKFNDVNNLSFARLVPAAIVAEIKK